jgi:hypothetical protein
MSTSADFRLTSPINAAVAVAAGRMVFTAATATVNGASRLLQAIVSAAMAVEHWANEVDRRHANQLRVHRLHLRPEYLPHLEAALEEGGYTLEVCQPTQWEDAQGRKHLIHQVWRGSAGELGLALLDDGQVLGYVRSLEMEAQLCGPIMTDYTQRVMLAHFAPSAAQGCYQVSTDDGGSLPTQLEVDTRKGVASVEVLNPEEDERCVGAMARIREVMGEPEQERQRVRRKSKPGPVKVAQPIPAAQPMAQPQKQKVRL